MSTESRQTWAISDKQSGLSKCFKETHNSVRLVATLCEVRNAMGNVYRLRAGVYYDVLGNGKRSFEAALPLSN